MRFALKQAHKPDGRSIIAIIVGGETLAVEGGCLDVPDVLIDAARNHPALKEEEKNNGSVEADDHDSA